MPFIYDRTIHFQDTDAAGVVYFANVLNFCHEAYEASLIAVRIDLKTFFRNPQFAIPITQASIEFYQPMFCGDRIMVELTPQQLNPQSFEIHYKILANTEASSELDRELEASANLQKITLGKAITKHICIDPTRTRAKLPPEMEQWLQTWQV
jgi:1,4-dihydroxy-2-naphthoyl-CoA hydrolase